MFGFGKNEKQAEKDDRFPTPKIPKKYEGLYAEVCQKIEQETEESRLKAEQELAPYLHEYNEAVESRKERNMNDDVIERMAEAMIDNGAEGPEKYVRSDIIEALRAVHDTHRLVPVEPTEEMYVGASIDYDMTPLEHWDLMLGAAPDYTDIKDE